MSGEYIELEAHLIPKSEIQFQKSKDVLYAIKRLPFVELIECRKNDDKHEIIIFDLIVQVPQKRVNDIRPIERIAVEFEVSDTFFPRVLALRNDFPRVPHQYRDSNEYPRSLCLYEAPYSEVNFSWTAFGFIERIRDWLRLTALDKLHQQNQQLEPFLSLYEGVVILPKDFILNDDNLFLTIKCIYTQKNGIPIFRSHISESPKTDIGNSVIGLVFQCPIHTHGIIYRTPSNINDLNNILSEIRMDFISELRTKLFELNSTLGNEYKYKLLNSRLMIILLLPKLRVTGGAVENLEICAFMTVNPICEIGKEIGIWEYRYEIKDIGGVWPFDVLKNGESIRLLTINTISEFNRELAIKMSSLDDELSRRNIFCVGVGALGSQIFENSIRAGLGKWTILDDDILYPHNLARHTLTSEHIGYPKVESLRKITQEILKEKDSIKSFNCDIMSVNDADPAYKEIIDSISESDLILDISTSIPAARYLVLDLDSNTKRASMFMNPMGTDVVVLCEDNQRSRRLDMLEMQYYRGLLENTKLSEHLHNPEPKIGYSNSCRDISSRIPQDAIALGAAICTNELKNILSSDSSIIKIWKTDNIHFTSELIEIQTPTMIDLKTSEWHIVTDEYFLEKMITLRISRLPNETGGIIIGSYDFSRKIIYTVDLYGAPIDSYEYPPLFRRGKNGLNTVLEKIKKITDNNLFYIGEWHSHPDRFTTQQSDDDIKAFNWQRDFMTTFGQIPLMLICGSDDYSFYIETSTGDKLMLMGRYK